MARHYWNCSVVIQSECRRYCDECQKDFDTLSQLASPLPRDNSHDNGAPESEKTDAPIPIAERSLVCMGTLVAYRRNGFCSICGARPSATPPSNGKGKHVFMPSRYRNTIGGVTNPTNNGRMHHEIY